MLHLCTFTSRPDCKPGQNQPVAAWLALGADPWVVSTMTQGYCPQFLCRPPATRSATFTTVSNPQQAKVLRAELSVLLEKGAIREVECGNHQAEFYSHSFLVTKQDGGLRPILDLRELKCCSPRPPGHLHSDSYLAGTLAFSEVQLGGQSFRVWGSAFRHIAVSPNIHSMHRGSRGTYGAARTENPQFSGRLAVPYPSQRSNTVVMWRCSCSTFTAWVFA